MTTSGPCRMVVRPAVREDLERMSAWQCAFLPHGLFPHLGERFVRHWHATFLDAPFGVALVADLFRPGCEPQPVGFLVGSTDQVRHIDDVVRRQRLQLGAAGAVALALRPRLAAHFLRTRARAYGRRLLRQTAMAGQAGAAGAGPQSHSDRSGTAVITAVAVVPEARGSGAGKALVQRFLDQARASAAPRAELAVMAGPGQAEAFYARMGWKQVGRHLSKDGSLVLTFRHELNAGDPA